ncbi:MAG: DUF1800 domain-containing protein [Chloroflexota bacterium]|mgnify:CR=1 FL=1
MTDTERGIEDTAGAVPATPRGRDRRTVLAVAAAAGIGVAARGIAAAASGPAAVQTSGTPAASAVRDWDAPLGQEGAKIAHLLRRAAFGATAVELEGARSLGYARTVDRLLETTAAEPAALAGADDASMERPLEIGKLQQWWIDHMLATPTPFAERMTFFWHGHFTTEARKVNGQGPYLYWQNLTWRRHALSDLRTFLYQVTIDPAMLRYLDLSSSTAREPNENYARELMELFTMGPGNYTEADVKAAARALTGWRVPHTQQMIDGAVRKAMERGQTPRVVPKPDAVRTGIFEKRRAYRGPAYAFLGETKVWNTEAVIDKILAQDATAPFVVRALLTHFVTPAPADAYVARLAARFRKNAYDLRSLMRDIFTSPEFTSPATYRALVEQPVELMVHAVKALGDPALVRAVTRSAAGMGQVLFNPPDVGGWPENAHWISSNTMLARANFATGLVASLRRLPSAADAASLHLDGVISAQTRTLLETVKDDRGRWSIVLASPEFQLK